MTENNAFAGMFDGIEDAKASFDSNYERNGHYIMRIDRVKADKSRKGDGFVAFEKTVLHVFDDGDGERESWHRPGEAVTHMLMEKHDSFLGNLKAAIAGCFGCDPTEVTKAVCTQVVGAEQALAGMIVEMRNRDILTRAGNPFTKVTYRREVPASELAETLSEKMIATFFPGDTLAEMIAEEETQG